MKASYNLNFVNPSVENSGFEILSLHEMFRLRGGIDPKPEPKEGDVIPPDED